MAIHSVYTLSQDDPEARSWLAFLRRHGQPSLVNLLIERVFWLEGEIKVERLLPLIVNPLYQTSSERSQLDPARGPIVEIAYRPAVTDPETPSILAGERAQARPHTDAEIEILVQSWSDHCYHTTWKSLGLLKKLAEATARIRHPLVVSVFKDNAGGIEFYDDWVVTIKGETHNFPSSIAPFGGVATKHGGVIRDTLGFGKGAYPIGGTTIMGTMDPRMKEDDVPSGALPPQLIVSESIRATAYYTNPMGIPMMHAIYRIHPRYAKCLALGHSVGLVPRKDAMKDEPR